jgi:3-methyladenine DNA glycosylase AlkC
VSDKKTSPKILLKDILFNPGKISLLAGEIRNIHPSFPAEEFVQNICENLGSLELKQRIVLITESLKKFLPADYLTAADILIRSLPPPCDPGLTDGDFGDFIYAPFNEFIARYGCSEEYFSRSLQALKTITTRFSAEDAIRSFICRFPEKTFRELFTWCDDPHYHVRRLCSEGTRPKLPWSQKIPVAVTEALPILNRLFADRTRYVTRSVANHMNDISKTDPDLVIQTLTDWKNSGRQTSAEMDFILRHSLRSLIRQGHSGALALLGVHSGSDFELTGFSVSDPVVMNSELVFFLDIHSPHDAEMIADYIIRFRNKAGQLNGGKVFKLMKKSLKAGERVQITKRHLFRQFMTTRTLYPGTHQIMLQINGNILSEKSFEVTESLSEQ